ncbi:MAG: hypothetical protein IJN09_03665 [Oscillospiraceae bacterium]|nr:hypothetical protein [Oscillospiraceae bacterium]
MQYTNLPDLFKAIAQAIRNKNSEAGVSKGNLKPVNFSSEIISIPAGTDTTSATAVAADLKKGVTAYARGRKITGTGENLKKTTATITSNSTDFYIGYFTGDELMLQEGNVGNSARFYVGFRN